MEPRHLIDDIDARQNDLLAKLTDLNSRVESLVNEWLVSREPSTTDSESLSPPKPAPGSKAPRQVV